MKAKMELSQSKRARIYAVVSTKIDNADHFSLSIRNA